MNVVLARTFLEVVESGNFFTAADRLTSRNRRREFGIRAQSTDLDLKM
jgi:hypothetical protein